MHVSRRALLSITAAAIPAAVLAGCAGGNVQLTPQQVIDDANNIVAALGTSVSSIGIQSPGLIPAATVTMIMQYISDAHQMLSGLSAATAANSAAPVLHQVVADVEVVLTTLTAIPAIPAQYVAIIQAAAIVLPIVEAFVNSVLGAVTPAPVSTPSPEALANARKVLQRAAR
jgi:hypothetical protein